MLWGVSRKTTAWTIGAALTCLAWSASAQSTARPPAAKAPRAKAPPAQPPANKEPPVVLGTQPVDGGKLVGNVVMFAGYNLVKVGVPLKAKVVDVANKADVPHKVKGMCRDSKVKGGKKQCFVEIRLLRWLPGKKYEVTFSGHTIRVTVVEGDPGKLPRPRL